MTKNAFRVNLFVRLSLKFVIKFLSFVGKHPNFSSKGVYSFPVSLSIFFNSNLQKAKIQEKRSKDTIQLHNQKKLLLVKH